MQVNMQSTTLLHRTLCLETALSVIISSFSQEKKGVAAFANKVMDLIDTMATSGIDRTYIGIQMESTINGKHFSYPPPMTNRLTSYVLPVPSLSVPPIIIP